MSFTQAEPGALIAITDIDIQSTPPPCGLQSRRATQAATRVLALQAA